MDVRPGLRVDGAVVTVISKLADDLAEAASAARHAGDDELARSLEDRVEVLRWADSRTVLAPVADR